MDYVKFTAPTTSLHTVEVLKADMSISVESTSLGGIDGEEFRKVVYHMNGLRQGLWQCGGTQE